jgi:hypothetical protein
VQQSAEALEPIARDMLHTIPFAFEDEVYRDFEIAVFLDNDTLKMRNKALYRGLSLNDLDGAIEDATRAIQLFDGREPCFADRSMFYYRRFAPGDLARSFLDLKRAITVEPEETSLHLRLADLMIRCGLNHQALLKELEVYRTLLAAKDTENDNFVPLIVSANLLLGSDVDEKYLGLSLLSS